MARLSDVNLVIRRVGLWTFTKRVWREVSDDHLLTWAAALAYSWLFAVFPFLIFLLTLVPYLPDNATAQASRQIQEFLYTWLAESSAYTIWENIKGVLDRPRGGLMSIGVLVSIWAASGGVNMTITALDRCFEIDKGRSMVRQRLLAIAITVVVASMILAVLVLIPIGNILTRYVLEHWPKATYLPQWLVWLWYAARYVLAGVLMFTVVAVMYHFGPCVKQRWRVFSPGAVFSVGVWILLGVAFRWYVNSFGRESYNRTYGTVGGVAVLLLFFYFDAIVFMIGAEINSEIDYEVLGVPRGSTDFVNVPQPMFADMSQPMAAAMASDSAQPNPASDGSATHADHSKAAHSKQ